MLLAGMAQTQIANHFNVSIMTIYRLMIRLRDTGNTSNRPRSERPRVTTSRKDRHIRFIHLRNRFVTAVHTARLTPGRTNIRISDQTVRNRLHHGGLRARRPLKDSTLKQRHRAARLQWCLLDSDGIAIHGKTFSSQMNPYLARSLVMGGRVFTVVAENASLTLMCCKQTVLAEVAS